MTTDVTQISKLRTTVRETYFRKHVGNFVNVIRIPQSISGHSKNLLNRTATQYRCNCRNREDCPLQIHYLTPNIIYRADVHCQENKDFKFYFGAAQTAFKERFQNHDRDFNHKQYIKSTKLSKYIWLLKDARAPCTISWSLVAKVKSSTKIDCCPLCLNEKYHLMTFVY